jgi:hypothetical protein
MANVNNLSRNILQFYNKSPFTVTTILKYNLVNLPFDVSDNNGNTLLHHIVMKNDAETLTDYLNYVRFNRHNNLLNKQNNDGDTALHIAVRNENEHFAKLLDNAGINKSIKNNAGEYIMSDDDQNKKNKSDSINLSDLNDTESKIRCTKYTTEIMNKNKDSSDSASERFFEALRDELEKLKSTNKQPKINRRFTSMFGGANEDSSTIEINFVNINNTEQFGGARRKRSVSSNSSKSSKRSTGSPKESSTIHDNVVAKFTELGYPDDDAKAMKAGLYSMVK